MSRKCDVDSDNKPPGHSFNRKAKVKVLRKGYIVSVLYLTLALVTACGRSCERGQIILTTNARHYLVQDVRDMRATLWNCSSHDISGVTLRDLKVYLWRPGGWYWVHPSTRGCVYYHRGEDDVLRAGEGRQWDLGGLSFCSSIGDPQKNFVVNGPRIGYFVLAQEYMVSGLDSEFVVFSDKFTVAENLDPEWKNANVWVSLGRFPERTVRFHNESEQAVWLNPLCSDRPTGGEQGDTIYPYAHREIYPTLQRQTDEETWQVIRPERKACLETAPPLEIKPGNSVLIELWQGYPVEQIALTPGTYRWDIVYFQSYDSRHNIFETAMHIFTETFDYTP